MDQVSPEYIYFGSHLSIRSVYTIWYLHCSKTRLLFYFLPTAAFFKGRDILFEVYILMFIFHYRSNNMNMNAF